MIKKHHRIAVFAMAILLILVGQVFGQEMSEDNTTGIMFSPMMHRINVNTNDLRNLRREGKDLIFDITVGNNLSQPVSFKAIIGNLEQKTGTFQLAGLEAQTELYTVKEQDRDNPREALLAIAKEVYGNEGQAALIARFNRLKAEYQLPAKLFIPKIRPETYEIQPGDLLTRIAKRFYGDESLAVFIAEFNGLRKPYQVSGGQTLYIAEIRKERYVVQGNETLESIAQDVFGANGKGAVPLIALANGLVSPYRVSGGQSLVILEIQERYIVQENDNLSTVASSVYKNGYGGAVIAKANGLEMSYVFPDGKALFIPKIKPKIYVAQTGDTLEAISEKMYKDETGAELIGFLNGVRGLKGLNLGQKLYIPEVKPFKFSCAGWIKPVERNITLEGHESRKIAFKVEVPGINIDGTYSAMVGAEMVVPDTAQGGIRSVMSPAGYCTVILNITGRRPLPKRAELHSFEIQRKKNVMGLVFGLKNLGNVMVQVQQSKVLVLREDRSPLFNPMPLGMGLRIVLPENRIELGTGITPLPPGKYIAQATVDYGGRSEAFLEREFVIGEKDEKARARTVSFIAASKEGGEEIIIPVRAGRKNVFREEIRVQNLEISPMRYKMRVVDIPDIKPEYSAKDVLSIRPESFEVQPLRTRSFQVILRDPAAIAGGKYAQVQVMGFIPKDDEVGENQEVKPANQIEILPSVRKVNIYEISTEDLLPELKTAGFTSGFKEGILTLEAALANTGNIHVKPTGHLYVMDKIGQIVFSAKLDLPYYVYPSEERKVPLQIDLSQAATVESGQYTVEILFGYGGLEPLKLSSEFIVSANNGAKDDESAVRSEE